MRSGLLRRTRREQDQQCAERVILSTARYKHGRACKGASEEMFGAITYHCVSLSACRFFEVSSRQSDTVNSAGKDCTTAAARYADLLSPSDYLPDNLPCFLWIRLRASAQICFPDANVCVRFCSLNNTKQFRRNSRCLSSDRSWPLCRTALAGLFPARDSLLRCWCDSARHSTSAKRALSAMAGWLGSWVMFR